jgi:hypothetical protein
MELAVCTVSVIPAGIVAAFKDEAAKQTQAIEITARNLCLVILV